MNAEFDYDLTPDQWETLKALRLPASKRRFVNQFIVESLITLQLVAICDNVPAITSSGRKALVRGSPRLWDVAA
jgi:hypothetical protein